MGRIDPLHGGRSGGGFQGGDLFDSCCSGYANSGGLDACAHVSVPLAGRGGEGGDGDGVAGVGLFWWGSVEVGWLLRPSLLLETATTRWWWLGEVSPPMLVQRLRFRLLCRMVLAVRQRSVSAIGLHWLVGVWRALLLPFRRCSGGAGVWKWWPWRWLGWRTCGGFFGNLLFFRVLFALFPEQVAFGLLLVCGCVCVKRSCTSSLY